MNAVDKIFAELHAQGVRIEARPHGGIRLVPAHLIGPELLNRIHLHKAAVIVTFHAEQEAAESDRVARAAGSKPLPPDRHLAYSILTTCQRAGVALRSTPKTATWWSARLARKRMSQRNPG